MSFTTLEAAEVESPPEPPVEAVGDGERDRNFGASDGNWHSMTMTDITECFEGTDHAGMRVALTKASALINKVVEVHGAQDPRLETLRKLFLEFRAEVEVHMAKEEIILFPVCRKMDIVRDPCKFSCGSIVWPIQSLMAEHERAEREISAMWELMDGFTPPSHASGLYAAMLQLLREIETGVRRHMHVENHVLFPKALESERRRLNFLPLESIYI